MSDVIFSLEVIDAAKAHRGKVIELHVPTTYASLVSHSQGTNLYGWTDYADKCYDVIIRENKDGKTDAFLETRGRRNRLCSLHFKSVRVL